LRDVLNGGEIADRQITAEGLLRDSPVAVLSC
jgi:hypothetical protein